MRKLLPALSLLTLTALTLPAVAQNTPDPKMGDYDEIVIRKKNDGNAKVMVELKDGEIMVDGKKLKDYDNDNIVVLHRVTRKLNGNMGMGLFQPQDTPLAPIIRPLRATLGVITQKKEAVGVTITSVAERSGAEKAGLKVGDVITQVDDKKVNEPMDLFETINPMNLDDKITITYKRNGKESKVTATLGKNMERILWGGPIDQGFNNRPSLRLPGDKFSRQQLMNSQFRLGLSVQDTEDNSGAKVLLTSGAAAKAGFQMNDIIIEMAGQKVKNAKDVAEAYQNNKEKGNLQAKVMRAGKERTLNITVPKRLNTENL